MPRSVVRRVLLRTFAIVLLMHSAVYGQSLGDVARENRDKQNADDASPTLKQKVIRNKDLPKDPNANQATGEAPPDASKATINKDIDPFSAKGPSADQRLAEQRLAQQRLAEQRAAEQKSAQQLAEQQAADQWKRKILAQKNKMATLQARIDQLHASIRSAGGSVQSEGPYNRSQTQQLQRAAQIQQQLDGQKRKLDYMQDAARHAGMHTAVYDP